jgi:hypothetical protein
MNPKRIITKKKKINNLSIKPKLSSFNVELIAIPKV